MRIDWTRAAKPQADGYDIAIIKSLENRREPRRVEERGAFCDGFVEAVVDGSRPGAEFCRAKMADERWGEQMTSYLRNWKAGYRFLVSYLDQFRAYSTGHPGPGCSSGHDPIAKGGPIHHNVYVTVDDPGFNGTAQGIYHELGHLRLESLGMWIDHHDGRLIANAPEELYDSPVRTDRKRPMSAVIHATYAWLMFTENDWQNYVAGMFGIDLFHEYSLRNHPKIRDGIREIERYAKPTRDGERFLGGVRAWAEDLLVRSDAARRLP